MNPQVSRTTRAARRARIAAVCATALIASCSSGPQRPPAPPLVLTTHATGGSLQSALTYSGEVRARFETPLSFRIAGRLIARPARLGENVKKGTLLAELDPADASAAASAAEAALHSAQNRFELARQVHERTTLEVKEDLVSRTDAEQSDANFAVAKGDVEQARAQLEIAQNQSRYTRLVAERDGLITSELAEVGAVLAVGQPVVGFAYAGERDAVIDIPEDRIAGISVGQEARVTLSSQPGSEQSARVRELAQAADPQSRTFRVKLALTKPDAVRPGMTATVTFAGAPTEAAVRIPAGALFHSGAEPAVWVVRASDQVLELRRVAVARYAAEEVELARGLVVGEEIVTVGVHTVTAGTRVRPVADPSSASRS